MGKGKGWTNDALGKRRRAPLRVYSPVRDEITQRLRPTWRPRGESNPGLRVENPANSPLFYRDRRGQRPALECRLRNLLGHMPSFSRGTQRLRPAALLQSLSSESNRFARVRDGRLPRRLQEAKPVQDRRVLLFCTHYCGDRGRPKSLITVGVAVSNPTTSSIPASFGSAIVKPFDTIPTTTSFAGIPIRCR